MFVIIKGIITIEIKIMINKSKELVRRFLFIKFILNVFDGAVIIL